MKRAVEHKILAGFVAALVIMVIIGGISYCNTVTSLRATSAQEKILALETTLSTMQDAETGQRGYLLTGADRYLEPYTAARAQINPALARLHTALRDDPAQLAQLPLLEQQIARKLQILEETIDLRRTQGFVAAQTLVLSDQGKNDMDAIRATIASMLSRAQVEAQQGERESEANAQGTIIAFALLALLAGGLLALVYYLVRQDLAARQQAVDALRASEARYRTVLETSPD